MSNLLQFLVRFHAFFLFVVLEVFALTLVVRNSNFHRTDFINASNSITGNFYDTFHEFESYLDLAKVNESLKSENRQLRRMVAGTEGVVESFPLEWVDTSKQVEPKFQFIPAKVIRNSTNLSANYIFLNKGSEDGITKRIGVVGPQGIVGIVTKVSKNFSLAMSVLHKDIMVSAKLMPDEYFGHLIWDGQSIAHARLKDIPKHVVAPEGAKIVTSGYSTYFPGNIPIGNLTSLKIVEGTNFLDIELKLATNFSNLKYVYITKPDKAEQLNELEEAINE